MSLARSDHKPIPTSGIIPDDRLPADEFSFAYTFIYAQDADLSPGAPLRYKIKAEVVLELKDSSGVLKATFTGHELYILDLFIFAPGLASFVWSYDINQEKFTGIDGAGQPVATLAQASAGVELGESTGTTDKTATVSSTFYSNIFLINLASGDTLKLLSYSVTSGSVIPPASLSIATRIGGTSFDALRDPRLGQSWYLFVHNNALYCGTTWKTSGVATATESNDVIGSLVLDKSPRFSQLLRHGATLMCAVQPSAQVDTAFRILISPDESQSWKEVMNQNIGINVLAVASSDDGAMLYAYGIAAIETDEFAKGVAAWAHLKAGADSKWTLAARGACSVTGAALPLKAPVKIELIAGTFRMTGQDQTQIQVWISGDELKSWKEQ